MDGADDVAELRRRLDMAEDELTFLKAVFEEYKDSSGELEAELDAQLKDLERSNVALKRENEQIRAQLQSTVARSRKSAEEASNLTTALEAHLEELTKREKKAQSRIKSLEAEVESLGLQVEAGGAGASGGGGGVPDEVADKLRGELSDAQKAKTDMANKINELKQSVYDARVQATRLSALTSSRFATNDDGVDKDVPPLPSDAGDDIQAVVDDMAAVVEKLTKTEALMTDTDMARTLLAEVNAMMQDHSLSNSVKLEGNSEQAINKSCLLIIGKIMVLGENLPEFMASVNHIKKQVLELHSSSDQKGPASFDMAHKVLSTCQQIMTSVFDPMGSGEKEKELEEMSAKLAQKEAGLLEEMDRQKKEFEAEMRSARTEASAKAEEARRQALAEVSLDRKQIEEEIYQSVASEMDALRQALESEQAKYKQANMRSQMYQNSMKKAIQDRADAMLEAMGNARKELETLKRSSQQELSETQKTLNEQLNHIRKVCRTIAKSDVAQLSMMYERELDMRVKMQDQIQALKGNIRVFCRIRPLLGNEIENGEVEAVQQTDEMTVTAEDPDNPGKPSSFNFDRVFGPQDNQEIVFDEMRTLCLSALDGYNVCLFAYGITGSGKTFTVEGGDDARDDPKKQGLVFRTVKELFRIVQGERAGAYDTQIQVQLMELYNEDFRDLLAGPDAPKPEVRIIPDVGVKIDNVSQTPAKTVAEAMQSIKTGYENRTVRSTNSNNVSSRSHSILTLHLNGVNLRTKKTYYGKLHFVDLAGSERVGKSGVQGEAMKEAQAINKSLSALGDVIQALSKKEKFVPFRNSQLTKLLQESLGGNSKTVMISNISPCKHSMSETINSLRFATRAHSVEMGKATKQESGDGSEVKQIKNKLADLESKFNSRGGGGGRARGTSDANGRMRAPGATPRGNIAKERSPRASKGRK